MSLIVIERRTDLPPAEAWRRLTTWERHSAGVPFTRIRVDTPPPQGLGTRFTARTRVGPIRFDDPMRVTVWTPPKGPEASHRPEGPAGGAGAGYCRLEKTGRYVTGWAEIEVAAEGTGSWVRWREELRVSRLPRALDGLTAVTGKLVFGRAVDTLLAD
ncbi:SRPBCC family protein [Streptomyces sp. NBC_01190]|uniref:SRPBCC family protein n=1 Tax=Streptomyces sp. NBC_01190 TaxID=2903767 RepID=UPI00386E3CEA|nr:SRPBCC family protein [Streptomyces sp. NBC_01190]